MQFLKKSLPVKFSLFWKPGISQIKWWFIYYCRIFCSKVMPCRKVVHFTSPCGQSVMATQYTNIPESIWKMQLHSRHSSVTETFENSNMHSRNSILSINMGLSHDLNQKISYIHTVHYCYEIIRGDSKSKTSMFLSGSTPLNKGFKLDSS